jgi:hypothetical protein
MLERIIAKFSVLMVAAAFSLGVSAQSTDQAYPTAVTTNEVSGIVKARDIGDARLTTYFYTFGGDQGDIFVNIVSKNFNGDVDIFIADGLRPLSKIVVYADAAETETGRVLYLRKPEKLLLRIEGRTPNDDPASFRIKFGGSFVAAVDTGEEQPELPTVTIEDKTRVKVNSVGTIVAIEPKPKRTPRPLPPVAAKPKEETKETKADERVSAKPKDAGSPAEEREEPKPAKPEVIVTEDIPESVSTKPEVKKPAAPRTRSRRKVTAKPETTTAGEPSDTKASTPKTTAKRPARTVKTPPTGPDPLAQIHLRIEFKDGGTIEKAMSDVLRFSVDRGILTIIFKDGSISRYPITDIAKTTIE